MSTKEFSQSIEALRTVSWQITAKAHAFRELRFEDLANDLYVIAGELDEIADNLRENRETELSSEWNETRKRTGDILSALLEKSIEEDEAGSTHVDAGARI